MTSGGFGKSKNFTLIYNHKIQQIGCELCLTIIRTIIHLRS